MFILVGKQDSSSHKLHVLALFGDLFIVISGILFFFSFYFYCFGNFLLIILVHSPIHGQQRRKPFGLKI